MLEELTPRQIVAELDRYIIGQNAAKRAVAIALRNRYRRRLLPDDLRDEVIPKNILMIGPTGVGKTEIARRLAHLAHAPFIKVEATKFTEVGYVGRDVDSMIRDLVQESVRIVEKEKMEEVQDKARARAVDHVVEILQPRPRSKVQQVAGQVTHQAESLADALSQIFRNPNTEADSSASSSSSSSTTAAPAESVPDEVELKRNEQLERIRQRIKEQILSGARDNEEIEIEIEDGAPMPMMHIMGGSDPGQETGGAAGGMDIQNVFGSLMPRRRKKKKVSIKEAIDVLTKDEARALIDTDQVNAEAITRAEQSGIIFVDEMDKIAGRTGDGGGRGPDVSREGVQRDILPIIEGSTVQTKIGQVRTDYMLFIAAGAFHVSKPSDLIPELQGRLPIRVELDSLTKDDFKRILVEPKNALITQYRELLLTEGLAVTFSDDAVDTIAEIAASVNISMENIGARRLHTIMERLLDELSFEASDIESKSVEIDAAYVHSKLDSVLKDEDLSHYIL